MGKRILIATMLVLTLLLLMPSIPAIQQKTIDEGIKQEMQEKIDTINLDKLEDIKNLEWIRHPIIYTFLSIYIPLRAEFVLKFLGFVVIFLPKRIESPIFIFLYLWLYFRLWAFRGICQDIANVLGWNWELPDIPPA